MEGELCIRPFEVGDQKQARWLILQGLGEHFGSIDETLTPDLNDILSNYIIPGHLFVVTCIRRELVGTGALISHGAGISELVRISTRKDYRRRGIGQAIVTYLVNVARQRGDRRIIVKTNASWHDAIHLYKRLGFVEYGRTDLGLELLFSAPEQGAEADTTHIGKRAGSAVPERSDEHNETREKERTHESLSLQLSSEVTVRTAKVSGNTVAHEQNPGQALSGGSCPADE